jgi:hypothetical protein
MRRLFIFLSAAAVIGTAVLAGTTTAVAAPGAWSQTQVNAATQNGVAFIDTQQNGDGSFGTIPFAETGMALVAYSVVQNGNFSNLSPSYQAHVKAAIHYLLVNQQLDGSWADFGAYATYSTGIALAGLSAFTTVDPGVPAAIAGGRNFLINLDFQGSVRTGCSSADGSPTSYYCGGWNYDASTGRSDESNTGYAMFGLFLTGGVPASIGSEDIGWQHHVQQIASNPFATRNDGGGGYLPGINVGSFSSNANDTGTMLFSNAYDGAPGTDPHVVAGLKLGNDILDVYELSQPTDNMVFHGGINEDGSCTPGAPGCDWFQAGFEGGFHYSIFSLTKGLGEYIAPVLTDPNNWYAKVVDLLLTQQNPGGSWPQDGRDDASRLLATAFAVSALGLVAVEQPISNTTGVPFSGSEGTNSCGSVATFSDADAKAVATDYTATIDWGDGTPKSPGTISGSNGSFTVSGCHTYTEEGSHNVTVTIIDADNADNSATVTTTATVGDAALSSQCAMPTNASQAYAGPTATFNDQSSTGTPSDFSATINWGDSSSSAGLIVGGPGNATYTVSGSHTYTSTGFFAVTTNITDVGGSTTTAICNVMVVAFAPGGGSFAIGDLESKTGTQVTFWGAQWWKGNSTSTGSKASSFKGFAQSPSTPACGVGWRTDPGNSTPPPAGPLPAFMAVIVTSNYGQSGSAISGDTVHIVIVQTNPGYQPDPGHPGTGTVVAQVC